MKKICSMFLLLLAAFPQSIQAQNASPDSLLKGVAEKFPLEKLYFHFDKEAYLSGETIWFKAYLQSGNKPSMQSSMLCVEWLNDSGRLMQKKLYPLINSAASGSLDIPPGLRQMVTTVRAYTKNMMNLGLEGVYQHRLTILSSTANNRDEQAVTDHQIRFLPESGDLVAGVPGRVAFKINDAMGYPLRAEGMISDDKGKEITRFSSSFEGMGSFSFTPEAGASYFAQYTVSGATTHHAKLPAVKQEGSVLRVERQSGETYMQLYGEMVFHENMVPAYILGVMENTTVFRIPIPGSTRNVRVRIPMEQLPTGILQLTVFSASDKPLNERLVFVRNTDYTFNAELKTGELDLEARKQSRFTVTLEDSLFASFSVSVTDADLAMQNGQPDNIYSGLLLTGELRGYIHNPGYYFEADDETHRQNLDLLMMTHGWRRFNWDEILSGRLPAIRHKDDGYITLSGTVYNSDRTEIMKDELLSIFIKPKAAESRMLIAPIDKDGKFSVTGMIFEDTATLYMQLAGSKKRRPLIELSSQPAQTQFTLGTVPFAVPLRSMVREEMLTRAEQLSRDLLPPDFNKKAITMGEVRLTSKAKTPLQLVEEKYVRNPIFSSYSSKTLDLLNDVTARNTTVNIFEYLKGRLSSVTITGSGGDYFVNFRNTMSLLGGKIPMDLYLNEAPSNSLQLSTIPVNQVALVKVYPQGFLGGSGNSPGGALAIFTKSGSDLALLQGIDQSYQFGMQGFSPAKEFFSPDYAVVSIAEKDTRTTLYWDPYLRTSPTDRSFSFSFYNTDRTRRIRVVLEGMAEDGRLLHIEKILEK